MTKHDIPFVEAEDEAAFYGPKIDVQIWSVIGKEFSLATNQVDFAQPARFDLNFTNREGVEEVPLCIHRAPLSTHERMIGFLIEHYAGTSRSGSRPSRSASSPSRTGRTSMPTASCSSCGSRASASRRMSAPSA